MNFVVYVIYFTCTVKCWWNALNFKHVRVTIPIFLFSVFFITARILLAYVVGDYFNRIKFYYVFSEIKMFEADFDQFDAHTWQSTEISGWSCVQ
jgi:hypothetical protein